MKNLHRRSAFFLIACTFAVSAVTVFSSMSAGATEPRGTADEAIAMVKSAEAYLKKNGKDKTFADIANPSSKQFHDKDLYVFVYDLNGVTLAHGTNSRMVGKNLIDMKDIEGKFIIKSFIDLVKTKGQGWVDYKWPNPVTKQIEQKSSYVEKVDNDMLIGVGIYK